MINQKSFTLTKVPFLKLNLKLQLIRILFDLSLKNLSSIQFKMEGKNQSLNDKSKVVVNQSCEIIELFSITPFQFDITVCNNQTTICPFQLYFTLFLEKDIKRRIPINQGSILKHYYLFQGKQGIPSLDQIYSFSGGQIIYRIQVCGQRLDEKKQIKQSMLQVQNKTEKLHYSIRSSRGSDSIFKQTSTGIKSPIRRSKVSQEQQPNIISQKFENKQEFDNDEQDLPLEMTIEEIYDQLQNQKQNNQLRFNKGKKLKRKRSVKQVEKDVQRSDIKIKLVIILLALGVVALLFEVFLDGSSKVHRKNVYKGPKKAKSFSNDPFFKSDL